MSEEIENTRKKLIFRSGHRGTKEMDMLMGSFAEKYVPTMSEEELAIYEELLQENTSLLEQITILKIYSTVSIETKKYMTS